MDVKGETNNPSNKNENQGINHNYSELSYLALFL